MGRFAYQPSAVLISTGLMILLILLSPLLAPVLSDLVKPFSDGECEECHTGFEPFIIIPDVPTEVPESTQFEYRMIVENPWAHELRNLVVSLDLSGAPTLSSGDPGGVTDSTDVIQSSVSGGSQSGGTFEVGPGAIGIKAHLTYDAPILFIGDLSLAIEGPDGSTWTSDLPGNSEEIEIDRDEIEGAGNGEYGFTVDNEAPIRAVDYHLEITVTYSTSTVIYSDPVTIDPMEEETITFTLTSGEKGDNSVGYRITAEAHHDHTGSGVDDDIYSADGSTGIEVGDEMVRPEVERKVSTVTSLWYIGRFMGFFTAGLFTASFLSGGSIRSLKLWLEKRFRKRKNWHCIISITTVVSALVHMIVLYSGVYAGTYKGLGLGLTATLLMAAIGATGALRTRIARRIGDLNWRRLHFWLSVIVIIVFIIHGVKEGTDLAFLRWW
ncbi:MAG: hypothetical protein ACMUHB_03345 [Thermoplasmatota archaeon]